MPRAERLLEQARTMPVERSPDSTGEPWWSVWEALADAGCTAASAMAEQGRERWERVLAFNAERESINLRRGASEIVVAHTRVNNYGPLLRLGRHQDARAILRDCRAVLEKHEDFAGLGCIYVALADLEGQRDRHAAIEFERTALRYLHRAVSAEDAAIAHHNMATLLLADSPREALAHALAAAVIGKQTGLRQVLHRSVRWISRCGVKVSEHPLDFEEVCALVQRADVDLAELIAHGPGGGGDMALALEHVRALIATHA